MSGWEEPVAMQDGPNTHKYQTATHVTSWTVIPLHDPVTAVKHWYHVPTVLVEEIERSAVERQRAADERLDYPGETMLRRLFRRPRR